MVTRNTNTGFTIVELLIVIVVIAILAGIVFVGYSSVQNNARDVTIQTDLKQAYERMNVAMLGTSTAPTSFPSEVKTSPGNILSLTDHYGFEDAYCINAYQSNPLKVYSYRPDYGVREGLCPMEKTGTAIGGTAPEPVFGVNILSGLSDIPLSSGTGITYNEEADQLQYTPGSTGSYRTYAIPAQGSSSVTLTLRHYATQVAPAYSALSQSGVSLNARYYQSDAETSVNNSAGVNNTTITQGYPLNAWSERSYTFTTGASVRYIRIRFDANTHTSDTRIEDVRIVIND